jgi:hypothetical protein
LIYIINLTFGRGSTSFGRGFKKWFGDWENILETIKGLEILQSFFKGKTGLLGSVNNIEIGSINIYSGETGTVEKQYKDDFGLEHIIARRWLEGIM